MPWKTLLLMLAILLGCDTSALFAQGRISAQARRHFDRGTAAVETAASRQDLEAAVREFEEASRLAPDWPDVHYNLGLIRGQLEDFDGAIAAFRRYLRLVPQGEDAEAVRTQINKLEYLRDKKAEKDRIPALLEGTWKGFMAFCGGHRSELEFIRETNGRISVELMSDYDSSSGQAIDLQRVPVRIAGEAVSFSFPSTFFFTARKTRQCDILFRLNLGKSGGLKGTIFQDGRPIREIQLKKR
ncbi:MAG: tetratricopeptide repeat protein [Deltaproteobacteria bacterium]|nr:tetratricopeptide repeat protein [Deltaproteobacteria bacterium]